MTLLSGHRDPGELYQPPLTDEDAAIPFCISFAFTKREFC